MIKTSSNDDWLGLRSDNPIEVKLSSLGLVGGDRHKLSKEAGDRFVYEVRKILDQLDPVNHKYAHVISCGATEITGPNRNSDGWTIESLTKDMPSYIKHAKFYRDHKNKPGDLHYGQIKAAFFDPDRGYGRLLCELNATPKACRDKLAHVADAEISELEKHGEIKVSHGCFTDPTFPVLTRDHGYVGIAKLKVGDYVWSHLGKWQRVYAVTQRQYTGDVYSFRVNGLTPVNLEITESHPMWAKVFSGKRYGNKIGQMQKIALANRYFLNPESFNAEASGWVAAKHMQPGDRFFVQPVTRYPGYASIDSEDLATLMGYYVAEGSLSYNKARHGKKVPSAVNYSCNLGDSLVRRLPAICDKLWPNIDVKLRPSHCSDVGATVTIHQTSLAKFMKRTIGTGARGKTIPPEIFNAADNVKRAFIGSWLDGYGCVDKKGCRIVSAAIPLLLQLRDLLLSLDCPSAIYLNSDGLVANSVCTKATTAYAVAISWLDLTQFSPYSEKVQQSDFIDLGDKKRSKPACLRACPDGRYAMRISEVSVRHVIDVTVYNCEVENDESFSAAGLISHNSRLAFDVCTACGNKAKSRSFYCDSQENGGDCNMFGCKYGLAKIAEDGRVQFVDNPGNTFYDISSIGLSKHAARQADRIAFGTGFDLDLSKAESSKTASANPSYRHQPIRF